LGGYGAEAIHPYLALESIAATYGEQAAEGTEPSDVKAVVANYIEALGKGLKKVLSKMGISTYMSYTAAQIFEAVGLQKELVDQYFPGTTSTVEGVGIFEVAEEALRVHQTAFTDEAGAPLR